jgi:hypothetical protein
VRLGEYDVRSDPDCVGNICADFVQDIQPSKIIIHENFHSHNYDNDIGLVKLKNPIIFSIFVKPICFLHGTLMKKDFVGEVAEVVGWGIKNLGTIL